MASDSTSVLLSSTNRHTEAAMPAVEEFFRALAQRVRARLVNRSSANIEVRLASVAVQTLEEVKDDARFRASGVFGLVRFDTPRIPGLAALQRGLLTKIIGAMLGDDDEASTAEEVELRPLSPVESRIAQRIFVDLCADLGESWPLLPVPGVTLDGPPGNVRVVEQQGGDEEVYAATMEFGPEDAPYGMLTVAVPSQVLRALGQPRAASQEAPNRNRRYDLGRVMPVEVEVVAEVARLPMRVRDLRGLEVGDLVPLGPVHDALVRVNGRPLLSVEPGHANGQRSVRVLRRVR
jgi:flagellar motor switch protein FliM